MGRYVSYYTYLPEGGVSFNALADAVIDAAKAAVEQNGEQMANNYKNHLQKVYSNQAKVKLMKRRLADWYKTFFAQGVPSKYLDIMAAARKTYKSSRMLRF